MQNSTIATWSQAFSRAWSLSHVFILFSYWFIPFLLLVIVIALVADLRRTLNPLFARVSWRAVLLTGLNKLSISSSLCVLSLCSTSGPDSTLKGGSPARYLRLLSYTNSIGSSPAWSRWLCVMKTFLGNSL